MVGRAGRTGSEALSLADDAIREGNPVRALKLVEEARRAYFSDGHVAGLRRVVALAEELPPDERSAVRLTRENVLYSANENIRFLTRRDAIRTGEAWHDPEAEQRRAPPPDPPVTRRQVVTILAVLCGIAAVIAVVAVFTPLPHRVSHWLGCKNGVEGAPSASSDGSEIVFAKQDGCGTRLFSIARDGTRLHRLPGSKSGDGLPAWSPDGRTIAFVGKHGIYTMRPDGSGRTRISADGADLGVAWSPDGRRLAFTRSDGDGSRTALYTMRADGSGLRRVLDRGIDPATPAWSPDGRELAIARSDGVYVVPLNGLGLERVAKGDFLYGPPTPAWSPDGRTIAYVDEGGVRLVDVATHRRLRTIGDSGGGLGDTASWPPDGREIVYSVTPLQGGKALYAIRPDGTRQRLLTTY